MTRKLWIVFFIVILADMMGIGFMNPVLPEFSKTLGEDTNVVAIGLWIGIVYSSLSFSRLFSLPIIGRLSDKYGPKRFICIGLFIYVFLALAFLLATDLSHIAMIRFARGITSAMVVPIARAYVGDLAPEGQEGRYMGYFNISFFLGMGFGPLIGTTLVDIYSFEVLFSTMSGIWSLAFLVALIFIPPRGGIKQQHNWASLSLSKAAKILKNRLMLGVFTSRILSGMATSATMIYLPLFITGEEYSIHSTLIWVGRLSALGYIFSAVLQFKTGKLGDRYSKVKVIIFGGIATNIFFFAIPFALNLTHLFAIRILMAIGPAFTIPTAAALATSAGRKYGMGVSHSLLNMSMSIGHVISPIMLGLLYDKYGINWVFNTAGIVGLVGVLAFYLIVKSYKGDGFKPADRLH
ncbi:MAG: MFS transporter [Chloroflexi bacterium]|jgi:MFS transporter, DHA1 family, multidrug resistance protein|nr:MFS transporter [Chloroflexota bacterium]MBT7082453.1 MFS transporter [Chloroflexota bacterium]MBT7290036.1 MFS transporter [Chloroflexota bacterium]